MMVFDIRNDLQAPITRFRVKGKSMLPTLQSGDDVIIAKIDASALIPGDFVFISTGENAYVHRFIKRTPSGILTKGDGRRVPDPIWDASAIRGCVTEAWRGEKCIYTRSSQSIKRNRLMAHKHHFIGFLWQNLRRMKAWLIALVLVCVLPSIVQSAVTLAHFEVDPGEQAIFVYWETASEVGNLGFYLWRSEERDSGYVKLPISNPNLHFIPSADEGAGAFYDYVDDEVIPGILYYYKVQDVPDTGAEGQYTDPLSGGIGIDTSTPTMTPSSTPTLTPTNTETPTVTPTPKPVNLFVRFWAEYDEFPAGECTTLQWQTENVSSVFFDGEGVSGVGAKTLCICENEVHTLVVYTLENQRLDYTIPLTVTGECTASGVNPTPTVTFTPPSPTPRGGEVTNTVTPRPLNTQVQSNPIATYTPVPAGKPSATPATPVQEREPENRITGTVDILNSPTPTRVIVQGQQPEQDIFTNNAVFLIFAAFIGLGLIGIGIWFWRSR